MKILHRAKHLYSEEYFISESIKFEFNQIYLLIKGKWRECEQSTRSINFSDMLDSEGKKIFARLSENGKGGDIVQNPNSEKEKGFNIFTVIYTKWQIKAKNKEDGCFRFRLAFNNKVIGIQK